MTATGARAGLALHQGARPGIVRADGEGPPRQGNCGNSSRPDRPAPGSSPGAVLLRRRQTHAMPRMTWNALAPRRLSIVSVRRIAFLTAAV